MSIFVAELIGKPITSGVTHSTTTRTSEIIESKSSTSIVLEAT